MSGACARCGRGPDDRHGEADTAVDGIALCSAQARALRCHRDRLADGCDDDEWGKRALADGRDRLASLGVPPDRIDGLAAEVPDRAPPEFGIVLTAPFDDDVEEVSVLAAGHRDPAAFAAQALAAARQDPSVGRLAGEWLARNPDPAAHAALVHRGAAREDPLTAEHHQTGEVWRFGEGHQPATWITLDVAETAAEPEPEHDGWPDAYTHTHTAARDAEQARLFDPEPEGWER